MAAEAISPNLSREDMQAAIAKTVELRALHAALLQRNNTDSNSTHPSSSSPVFPSASCFPAQDYPVFTPSYEDEEPVPGYHQPELKIPTLPESWDESRIGPQHVWAAEDQKSVISSSILKNPSSLQNSPTIESFYKSRRRRNSMGDLKSVSARNIIEELNSKPETTRISSKNSNSSKSRGDFLARLFPKLRKKHKDDPEELQMLKKELVEANKHREAAVLEAAEMKSAMEELRQKLEQLETYCDGLKTALSEVKIPKPSTMNLAGEETLVDYFLQMVSESRFSVKQFCKILLADDTLTENLNSLLQPYNLSLLDSRSSRRAVSLYHLEAIMNETLYRDFENCAFRSNGCSKLLDPRQDRQARYTSFVSLRNLSWNEVLMKGTKFYSEEFSMFCDQKMNCIVTALKWNRPWPEQLLQAFFTVAKCVWLVHLLAFSFNSPVSILRVEESRSFDLQYMEDMVADRQQRYSGSGSGRVKVMVMPGFYVGDRVLRCKVLCKYKSVA